MTKSTLKYLFIIITTVICMLIFSTRVFAANENIKIMKQIKEGETRYLIYIKDNENTDFNFAFSNSSTTEPDEYNYDPAGNDSDSENSSKIAYVDNETISLFANPTYIWAKNGDNFILKGIEIDLNDCIEDKDLDYAASITKIIEADPSKTSTTEKTENGVKTTKTVGEIALKDENGDYSYIIIQLPNSEEYNNFMKLATRISKFNSGTDMYTKIEAYSEFLNLFNSLKPNAEAGWIDADKNIIYQPEDAEDGDEYVVWVKDNKTDDIDVQFLTSTKKFSEEKIKEAITTKLPVTYDDNTLLIVFAIVVVAIILVCIRIKLLNKKES